MCEFIPYKKRRGGSMKPSAVALGDDVFETKKIEEKKYSVKKTNNVQMDPCLDLQSFLMVNY